MNEDNLRAAAERGRQFRSWCEGPGGLYAIFAAVERDYLETLIASDIADHPLREKTYQRVAALRDIRKVLQAAITEGASAAATINHMTKLAEKKKART